MEYFGKDASANERFKSTSSICNVSLRFTKSNNEFKGNKLSWRLQKQLMENYVTSSVRFRSVKNKQERFSK